MLNNYKYILMCLPVISIVIVILLIDKNIFKNIFNEAVKIISEKNLKDNLIKAGFINTKPLYFQIIRIISSLIFSYIISLLFHNSYKVIIYIVIFIVVYKMFYLFILLMISHKYKQLNREFPYMLKTIILLAYNYPINTAIKKSIDDISLSFKEGIITLINDINNDPSSFQPYQNLINHYDNKIYSLDSYLKILYRMSNSSKSEEAKLLDNLNVTISNDVANTRKEKNDSTNLIIGYLGLIPIFLLSIMLCYLMIQSISIL